MESNYGILTLLPIIIVIAFALKTKRTMEALVVGTLATYIIIDGFGFASGWMDAFFRAATSYDHQWVFMVCGLFGSLIALLGASHATLGFSAKLEKLCRGPKSTLIVTWIMGILIFVDDYLNIMTLSTCMKGLTDKRKIPREALSYVIDSTGAPVCAILPFSTWAVFFATLFYDQAGVKELGYGTAIETFYHIIPFIFYAIAAVVIVPLFALNIIPKFGPMKKAYKRAAATGKVYSEASASLNLEEEQEVTSGAVRPRGNILDFVLPVGTLIVLAIGTGELFLAVIAAIAVCLLLYLPRHKVSFGEACDLIMHGFCNMIPTVAIIFFAFVMQEAMNDIGIAQYVISAVEPIINATILPALVFVIVAVLNFSTGSVWGIPSIVVPIIMPLTMSIGANPVLVMAAIVSGATLGSHACFYSDATVLTSSCCKMENLDHALSQFPYAALAAGLSVAGYLICGIVM